MGVAQVLIVAAQLVVAFAGLGKAGKASSQVEYVSAAYAKPLDACEKTNKNVYKNSLLPIMFVDADEFTREFRDEQSRAWRIASDYKLAPIFFVAGARANATRDQALTKMAQTCSDIVYVPLDAEVAPRSLQARNRQLAAAVNWAVDKCPVGDVFILVEPQTVVSWYLILPQVKIIWNHADFLQEEGRIYAGHIGPRGDLRTVMEPQPMGNGELMACSFVDKPAIFVSKKALTWVEDRWKKADLPTSYDTAEYDELLGMLVHASRAATPFYFDDYMPNLTEWRLIEKDYEMEKFPWNQTVVNGHRVRDFKQVRKRRFHTAQCSTFSIYTASKALSDDWYEAHEQAQWCGLPAAGFSWSYIMAVNASTKVDAEGCKWIV